MPPSTSSYAPAPVTPSPAVKEEQIEYGFIGKLQGLKYEYRPDIRDRAALERNFREKFEALNRVHLTDGEFARLLGDIVTPDVFTAAKTLRSINAFPREDGTQLNYTLVNIKDWCKNTFEVVNQLRINTDNSHHRYDVLILINGVPCVQVELKTLTINPRRAMEQIVDYKNDPGNGYTKTLLGFLQLFIVSNRTNTYYFANNNARHFAFNADERFLPIYQFADELNKKITQLDEFADKFLGKCTLGQTVSRYMVLVASEQKLLMMRPYQVYAVKRIVECIAQNNGNGYIWHTTGSGKTLTSFKASTLLKDNPDIEKCLFVVDRKDLDRQTREEFNRFQEGCVEENTNTATLVRRLLSDDYADKVIVTTIQKLGLALDENSKRNKQQKKDGTVPNGLAKPYLDHQGRIWVKQGADKRHVTAREEMQRMFQSGGLVYADVVPVAGTTSADLDEPAFRRYLAQHYSADTAQAALPLVSILQNLGLGDGHELTLAGLMLFGRNPLRWRPAFTIKAVAFYGTSIADTHYQDSQDFSGTLPTQYAEALAFIKRNLRRVQGSQGFNSPGILEVPEIALQELLVNALVHRDYFTSASIRILVFRDRIEIISPGPLPDSLSIDDIRHGKSNRRNPTLSEHAFRLLPYRGMGSGIPRALGEWPQIELISELSGNQFTALVRRPQGQWKGAPEQVEAPVTEQVTEQVRRLCLALRQGAKGTKELMQMLNLKHRPSFLDGYLNPALQQHLVEMTQPDSPRSPTQKYRLTDKGRSALK